MLGIIRSWPPQYWFAFPSAFLAIVTQDSGRAGAIVPAAAGSMFLLAGGLDCLRSMSVAHLFRNHTAGRLTTTDFIEKAEAKEGRRARGRVLLFCAAGLVLVAFVTMTFAGRLPVAVLGAGLLTVVSLRLAGFWPLRRLSDGAWLLQAAVPSKGVLLALRRHSSAQQHLLAWTQSGRMALLRNAAADAARKEPELARLLAARHASDSLFPRVAYRGGGSLADLHLLLVGGRLVGQAMALSCLLAAILSIALPRGAVGTWSDLAGLQFLEGLRNEKPEDPPEEEPSPTEDKSQEIAASHGGGGSGQSSGAGDGGSAGSEGDGPPSSGKGAGGEGGAGQAGGSGGQGGAGGGTNSGETEAANTGDASSSYGRAGGSDQASNPSSGEDGGDAAQSPFGAGAGEDASAVQGSSGQSSSAGGDAPQGSDLGGNGDDGSGAGGQIESQSAADGSASGVPSPGAGEAEGEGSAGQSPSATGGGAAQAPDPKEGGKSGDILADGVGASGTDGAGGNRPSDAAASAPTASTQGAGGGDQSGTARAGAGDPSGPAEATSVTEGPAPEAESTDVVALPSQGQGEAEVPPDALVLREAAEAPEAEGETASVGSAVQLYAEPGQAPDTIETRLFPDETAPPPPVAPDPPRQILPTWIRLILEESR